MTTFSILNVHGFYYDFAASDVMSGDFRISRTVVFFQQSPLHYDIKEIELEPCRLLAWGGDQYYGLGNLQSRHKV
jgi:hypothetical protein